MKIQEGDFVLISASASKKWMVKVEKDEKFHTDKGLCPTAEKAYEQILSLPMHTGLNDEEVEYVINTLKEVIAE